MRSHLLPHVRLGAGPPLVVIPGLAARRGVPVVLRRFIGQSQIKALAAHRTVWSIDRRSGLASGTGIPDLAAEYAQTLAVLFSGPVDVVGISTGGSVALQLTADYPHLVRRLVLVSSAHRLSKNGRAVQGLTAHLLRSRRPRLAAAVFLSNTATSGMTRLLYAVAGFVAPRLVVGHWDHDLLVTLEAEDTFDLEHRLEGIGARTLVAGGGRDRFYSVALFEAASAKMPRADVMIYRKAGHMSTRGTTSLVSEILRFLSAG